MAENSNRKRNQIIDCDVHPVPRDVTEIHKYLPSRWHKHYFLRGRPFYNHPNHVLRLDAVTPKGDPPGSDPVFMREHLLDEYGIDYAILLPLSYVSMHPNPDMANDLASAYNQWLADVWLDNNNHDDRYKGSITVAPQDPVEAAKEIERWAHHPHMVQVLIESGAGNLGHKQYRPIYEACERYGLPVAIHPTAEALGINAPASPSYPTTYMEWSVGLTLSVQAHLISFITEGVFERYPGLKLVLVEGGCAWLPTLLWRLDTSWKGLRDEVPWVKKLPSTYVKDHVRVTSQPLVAPDNTEHLLQNLEMMDAENILMFASDYPHWDFDSPTRAFPKLPEQMKQRIFYENAKQLYKLP
jgi:predicted TIM-barrel fold metal-dependent hydrolase